MLLNGSIASIILQITPNALTFDLLEPVELSLYSLNKRGKEAY
jgi:hypothetical protein